MKKPDIKSTRPNPPSPSPIPWLSYGVVAVVAASVSMGGTWWLMQRPASQPSMIPLTPSSTRAPGASQTSSDTGANAGDLAAAPPVALTNALPPAQAAVTQGNWYYDHKNWASAIQCYSQAIAQGLDNPNVRTDLGNAYRFAGQPQQALEQYRRAQKQDPQHENSLFNQGGLYTSDLNDPAKGIILWRQYLQRFPHGQSATQAQQLIKEAQQHIQAQGQQAP